MELKDYLFDKETIHESADVTRGDQSSGGKGKLACTSKRVVWVKNGEVVDISIDSVDALEYSAARYPKIWGITGSALVGLAVLSILFFLATDTGAALLFTIYGGVAGLILIGIGYALRKTTLLVHTPKETFSFTSGSDLDNMAHMIRAQESLSD